MKQNRDVILKKAVDLLVHLLENGWGYDDAVWETCALHRVNQDRLEQAYKDSI